MALQFEGGSSNGVLLIILALLIQRELGCGGSTMRFVTQTTGKPKITWKQTSVTFWQVVRRSFWTIPFRSRTLRFVARLLAHTAFCT